MNTSKYPNYLLAWRICRYLLVQLTLGVIRLTWRALVHSVQFVVGLLALMASPASSGRSQDEFKDLVQPDSPEHDALRANNSDGFWRMYFQAYSPRLWRMRRLLPMSAGRNLRQQESEEDR
ncbi:MAG TPA: hypothetical protein VFA32_17925 [Dehalococcoidia bacterium]|nr:hypothetical protein [Dehalococcoidia bacterium]